MRMRSIRLSLMIYFALLVTAALLAVSWLAYDTSAETLEERRQSSQMLIRGQCQTRIDEQRAALDHQLMRRAKTLTSLARTMFVHYDWLYPLGAFGAAALPVGHLPLETWLAQTEAMRPRFGNTFAWFREETYILDADKVYAELEAGPDYFQTYQRRGSPVQRSDSLAHRWFSLDPQFRETADLYEERLDDLELEPGLYLRRVTLLMPKQPSRVRPLPRSVPAFFIQYAIDTTALEAQIKDIRRARDDQLAHVDQQVEANLRQLKSRLFWIAGITLSALWLGAFVLIQVGLTPLARLADAVSRVSSRDFRLELDQQRLPRELQPIADRLEHTLGELGKAFEREKQAAADISHELRTPLASLMANVEVAQRKPRTVAEYQEILEDCRLSGQQMSHLVERLLALARLDAGAVPYRPVQVDVADLATQCADLVRPLARAKGLALRVDAEAPLPLETDPDKVREVLTNLLHNAIEYNRAGGAIDLAVRRVNGHIELKVADTGIGIPAEARARIFERFYRADPSRHADVPHAGLGLAIVKSYIDLMSGKISVESGAEGSTFRVELPCAGDEMR
jgi:heavy metal sensor kinase